MAGRTALVATNAARSSSSSLPPSSSHVMSWNGLIAYGVSALCTSTSMPPQASPTLVDHGLHRGHVAHVGLYGHGLTAFGLDVGDDLLGRLALCR